MKLIFSVFLLFFIPCSYAQNLAPNSNFEQLSACPTDLNNFTVLDWSSPFWPGTPDYFNVCSIGDSGIPINEVGNQSSSTGGAYVGIYTYPRDAREYIQSILTSPTIAGERYELSITYSSADNFGHSAGLGMLLSVGAPDSNMAQGPQMEKTVVVDSQTEWHTLSIEYLSTGGETHVTIGNFRSDSNSNFVPQGMYRNNAYYYIDSIAIKCIGVPSGDIITNLGEDVELCADDYPFTIVSNLPDAYNEWSTGQTGASIDVLGPGSYFVKSSIDCRYGVDTIVVTTIEEPEIFTDEIVCAEGSHTISLNSSLGDYTWSDGRVGPSRVVTESGWYSVMLSYPCGVAEDSFNLIIGNGIENLDLADTYVLCEGKSLPINLSNLLLDTIVWSDGSIAEDRVWDMPGEYFVKLTNSCIDTTITFEFIQENCIEEKIYVPNIFSPNNDGINDYISILFPEKWPSFSMQFSVFNQWGEQVFTSKDPDFRWYGDFKGKPLNPNVFVYYYELEFNLNGKTRLVTDTGSITIVN